MKLEILWSPELWIRIAEFVLCGCIAYLIYILVTR